LPTYIYDYTLYKHQSICQHPFKTGQQKGSAGILSALLQTQQEGMGLLEFQAMNCLRDVHSSRRMVVYIYYITAAGNSISSQLGSSCQGNRYSTKRAGSTSITYKITPAVSLSSRQPGGPPCWTMQPSPFGFIVQTHLRLLRPNSWT
jgi:hypothetical protein